MDIQQVRTKKSTRQSQEYTMVDQYTAKLVRGIKEKVGAEKLGVADLQYNAGGKNIEKKRAQLQRVLLKHR